MEFSTKLTPQEFDLLIEGVTLFEHKNGPYKDFLDFVKNLPLDEDDENSSIAIAKKNALHIETEMKDEQKILLERTALLKAKLILAKQSRGVETLLDNL